MSSLKNTTTSIALAAIVATILLSSTPVSADFRGEGERFSVVIDTSITTPPVQEEQNDVVMKPQNVAAEPKESVVPEKTAAVRSRLVPKASITQQKPVISEKEIETPPVTEIIEDEQLPCETPSEVRAAAPETPAQVSSGMHMYETGTGLHMQEHKEMLNTVVKNHAHHFMGEILPIAALLFATTISLLITIIFLLLRRKN